MNGKKASGISIAEYALIFALVAIVAIPALMILGEVIATGYQNNEPTSRATQLFSLLNAGGGGSGAPATIAVETAAPMGVKVSASQPVANLALNYNPQTGMVDVMVPGGSSGGGITTSADGTRVLAQNLASLADNPELTPQEQQALENLSSLGYKIAAEEEKLLQQYPELAEGKNVDLDFFNPYLGLDTTLYMDYQAFTAAYENLSSQLGDSDAAGLKSEVDANAALISQLAYKNFVEMQMRPENGAAASRAKEAAASMVTADGAIDIKKCQYKVAETPVVTEEASAELQDRAL